MLPFRGFLIITTAFALFRGQFGSFWDFFKSLFLEHLESGLITKALKITWSLYRGVSRPAGLLSLFLDLRLVTPRLLQLLSIEVANPLHFRNFHIYRMAIVRGPQFLRKTVMRSLMQLTRFGWRFRGPVL